uniref:Receptor ligand binding region domain-containing protein n=1 Tax=Periophthalmus magnuspinnatus TaxID=409849 RepID=A0A3B3ZLT3_9GOBI
MLYPQYSDWWRHVPLLFLSPFWLIEASSTHVPLSPSLSLSSSFFYPPSLSVTSLFPLYSPLPPVSFRLCFVNVAVVFSGSSYQGEVKGRLSAENFADLPVAVAPVTVLVNDTNPRDLLTRLCGTMATERLHGVVFEDDVVAEVAQILDFLSTQTSLPIVGISGGSAVVIPYKVLPRIYHLSMCTCLCAPVYLTCVYQS